MNSYGDGNAYRGTVCKESQVPTIMTDGKTAYSGQDYHVHSSAPWKVNDFDNAVHVIGVGYQPICRVAYNKNERANAKLIAAAPEMLEVLLWLDNEMDCRDDEYGGVLFSHGDFEKVRRAIKLAMEG